MQLRIFFAELPDNLFKIASFTPELSRFNDVPCIRLNLVMTAAIRSLKFSNLRFPDPLLKPNGTSAWRSDQFVYQSVAVFWMTEVYFIQLLQ
jgi:hypothetical protein